MNLNRDECPVKNEETKTAWDSAEGSMRSTPIIALAMFFKVAGITSAIQREIFPLIGLLTNVITRIGESHMTHPSIMHRMDKMVKQRHTIGPRHYYKQEVTEIGKELTTLGYKRAIEEVDIRRSVGLAKDHIKKMKDEMMEARINLKDQLISL
jgi:hypothetical protein